MELLIAIFGRGMSFAVNASTQPMAPSMSFWKRILPPEDISESGHLVDWLFNYTTYLNIFFFTLVCIGLFGFSYLYWYKRHPKAEYTYGNKKTHIIVATVIGVAVFFGVDMNITRMSNNDFLNVFAKWPGPDEDIIKVEVLAQQWMWNFRYAGQDGVFNTDDDVLTMNDLRLPVGKKVLFQVTSKDVIHSFFIPNARLKVDAIPGRITRMWVKFTKDGKWDIACAEMCGTFHYRMAADLTTYKPDEYAAWINEANKRAVIENDSERAEMYWGWKWEN